MKSQFTAIITGRVQMVMFRDFVQRKARGLGLVGFVQNLSDGSVNVVASGEKELLEQLVSYLNKGPLLARVESVSVTWGNPSLNLRDFKIIY